MSLEALISHYGYAAVAIGTFFEGETILVIAGFASHQGYLALTWVVFCGFLGSLCGDQLYFYLGRVKGIKTLDRRPRWVSKSKQVFNLLYKHQLLLILGFRFVYGLRTVTPFLIGASGVSPVRFLILNTVGAFLWAVSIGVLGYLFGHVLELFIVKIERYELLLFIMIAVLGLVIWSIHLFRGQRTAE